MKYFITIFCQIITALSFSQSESLPDSVIYNFKVELINGNVGGYPTDFYNPGKKEINCKVIESDFKFKEHTITLLLDSQISLHLETGKYYSIKGLVTKKKVTVYGFLSKSWTEHRLYIEPTSVNVYFKPENELNFNN